MCKEYFKLPFAVIINLIEHRNVIGKLNLKDEKKYAMQTLIKGKL